MVSANEILPFLGVVEIQIHKVSGEGWYETTVV